MKNTYNSYIKSKYLSIKHSNYFWIYDELLSKYINKNIIFVEVGVLNGGSLFMWRDFFGPEATIIGIDSNDAAKKWGNEGFIIEIGDQSDPKFWDYFYKKYPKIDILLDDGGHTNKQQITTLLKSADHINNGGVIIVEDTHCSYLPEFGNPHPFSFINFSKGLVNIINSRFPKIKASENILAKKISNINFYESIVAFHINPDLCLINRPVSNNGISSDATDLRKHHDTHIYRKLLVYKKIFSPLKMNNLGRLVINKYVFLMRFALNFSLIKLFQNK